MSSANEVQVGGTHYKGVGYQHWDFAADARLGYFEGQITKYISRYAKKNGVQDVDKARHFIAKLIELAIDLDRVPPFYSMHQTHKAQVDRFILANELTGHAALIVRKVSTWSTVQDLNDAGTLAIALAIELTAGLPGRAQP